jgi:colicin import membrane protein
MAPKKGAVNTKVEAANAKKAAAAAVKNAKAQAQAEAAESAEWAKGSNSRGDAKRQEEERKRAEAEAKKAEIKRLQQEEEQALGKIENKSAIRQANAKAKKKDAPKPWEEALAPVGGKKNNKGSRAPAASGGKVTQAMIAAKKEAEAAAAAKLAAENAKGITFETGYTENRNRAADVEGEARSVDAALDVLSLDDKDLIKHPEKRMKAVRYCMLGKCRERFAVLMRCPYVLPRRSRHTKRPCCP